MIGLWGKIKGWAALAGAALLAVGVAFLKGRSEGRRVFEAKRTEQRVGAMKERKDVDDEIDSLGHADVDQRLAKWMRDDSER